MRSWISCVATRSAVRAVDSLAAATKGSRLIPCALQRCHQHLQLARLKTQISPGLPIGRLTKWSPASTPKASAYVFELKPVSVVNNQFDGVISAQRRNRTIVMLNDQQNFVNLVL